MDDSEKRRKIVEQIAKLNEISNPERGATQGEINNAISAIARLMEKYSINWSEIWDEKAKKLEEAFVHGKTESYGNIMFWHWTLAKIIGRVTITKFYKQSGSMMFYGEESNVELAKILFLRWKFLLDDLSSEATKQYTAKIKEEYGIRDARRIKGGMHPRVYKESWLKGCTSEMLNFLIEEERNRSQEISTAIVKISTALDRGYQIFSKKAGMRTISVGRSYNHNDSGYSDGRNAGQNLRVSKHDLSKSVPELTG